MKFNIKLFFLLVFIFLVSFQKNYAVEIMPLKQIKKGMTAKVSTVFYGSKQEQFTAQILDIVYNVGPQSAMILARFSGENVERSGIAQGMSGSPVYIHGKLIGAVAFTWGNLKEPIGGIQPIEQMLPVIKESSKKISIRSNLPLKLNPEPIPLRMGSYDMKPLDTPLTVSGLDDKGFDFVKTYLGNQGITMVKGSGGGKRRTYKKKKRKKYSKNPLKAGDAVGILLMTGDASANAIGTVTYIDNKDPRKILIFGHPFQSDGYVQYPMTTAKIHYVMPSRKISWKFGSAEDIVGTIYNDRQTAVAGKIGRAPSMIPVNVDIVDDSYKQKNHFEYKIVKHPQFFPSLFSGILVSSYNRYNSTRAQTAYISLDVAIKNKQTQKVDHLMIQDYVTATNDQSIKAIASYTAQALQKIYYNFYNGIDIVSAKAKIKYETNIQLAEIVKVILTQNSVHPGESAKLKVVLNTYKNKKEVVTVKVPIPSNYQNKVLPVTLAGGKIEELNTNTLYKGFKDSYNYLQMLDTLQVHNNAKDLVAFYDLKGISANIEGFMLENLPLSQAIHYGIKSQNNKYFGAMRKRFYFKTNYIIIGQLPVMIPIQLN